MTYMTSKPNSFHAAALRPKKNSARRVDSLPEAVTTDAGHRFG